MNQEIESFMTSKKILIISYHFPPDLAVGAIRASKFVEYFPENNIEPIVLTVKEKYYEQLDKSFPGGEKDNKHIVRTRRIPNFRDIYLFLKRKLYRWPLAGNTSKEKNIDNPPAKVEELVEGKESFIECLKRYFNSLIVWLPDDKTGWIPPAILSGLWLIYKYKIDTIYSTSPPHTCHIIGLVLKCMTGKKWIADFRDPWIPELKPDFVRSKLSDIIENRLVQKVVTRSDFVVSATPAMTSLFKQTFPEVRQEKFITILNGYDSKDLLKYLKLKKYEKITFTYAGSFYLGRNPKVFLTALRNIINEGCINENEVAVQFIGDCRYFNGKSVEHMVQQLGLENIVKFIDYIPRHEALQRMAQSHILLLFAQNQPLQIPGKLYEYMGLQSIILTVCGTGATADILSNYDHSVLVRDESAATMKAALVQAIQYANSTEGWNRRKMGTECILNLERKDLTHELAELIKS